MEKDQLNKLIFPDTSKPLSQVETSISWVLFSEKRVYKIKRPVKTSFLDFTSLESRKYYCEKELILNQRFSSDLYLSVQPVRQSGGNYTIGEGSGPIVDYALEMKKLPTGKELNNLLLKNKVTETDIHSIAEVIATFHRSVPPLIIHNQSDLIKDKTSDILNYSDIFYTIDPAFKTFIEQSTNDCLLFIQKNAPLLESRMQQGYIRDGHGDLHSGNIFLLDKPVLFDCIEFSDALRQIDVMEELAFLSMDFDCFGRKNFGTLILDSYNSANPAIITPEDHLLFLFYKYYKAGVRAKVMAVQWSRELDKNSRLMLEQQMQTYILLMQDYFKQLQEGFS